MFGGRGPTPFCHGVQGTKISVYSGGFVSHDWVDVQCRLIKSPTATSEGHTASGGLVRISCLAVDGWLGYFEKIFLS